MGVDPPLVLSLGALHPVAASILSPHCRVEETAPLSPGSLPAMLAEASGLVVRADSTVTEQHIEFAANLRVIGRTGAGVDNVDIAATNAAGVPVVYAPAMNVTAVAEMTVGLFLMMGRAAPDLNRRLREGEWQSRDSVYGRELCGSTVGIVGYGKIGRAVAHLCRCFGATVHAYDPYVEAEAHIEFTPLDTLLATSDFISLHAPLTAETEALIDATRITTIKDGAVLVNVARGGLLPDYDALLAALEAGALRGVALDVFPGEPPDVTHPLFTHHRCFVTPHVAGMSEESMAAIFSSVATDIVSVLSGKPAQHLANPEVLKHNGSATDSESSLSSQ